MDIGITNQAYLFLIFILNGILISFIFDIFRILRKSFDTPNFVTYIEDILFWVISAIIVMYSIFVFNNGEFRAYIFIGIFLGIAIYMLFLSKTIINISVKIISFFKALFLNIIKIISYPIKIVLGLINKILYKPLQQISTIIYKSLANFVKKHYNIKHKNKNSKILQNKEGF